MVYFHGNPDTLTGIFGVVSNSKNMYLGLHKASSLACGLGQKGERITFIHSEESRVASPLIGSLIGGAELPTGGCNIRDWLRTGMVVPVDQEKAA